MKRATKLSAIAILSALLLLTSGAAVAASGSDSECYRYIESWMVQHDVSVSDMEYIDRTMRHDLDAAAARINNPQRSDPTNLRILLKCTVEGGRVDPNAPYCTIKRCLKR